nr:serine hydrolase domain-containing protein [Amycolatopsis thermalba]
MPGAPAVGGEVAGAAAGVLNRATGVEATPDSVFQIGSITKVWTTTLAMQLSEEGALDLDTPVRRYLPEFRAPDSSAAAAITVRQLMCHTSGFEGDPFTDTGRGDDCVERYVATLGGDRPAVPAGGDVLLQQRGLRRARPDRRGAARQALRPVPARPPGHPARPHALRDERRRGDRAAVGHLPGGQPAPVWSLARSNAPAGSAPAMRPRDLLAFARLHLSGAPPRMGRRCSARAE